MCRLASILGMTCILIMSVFHSVALQRQAGHPINYSYPPAPTSYDQFYNQGAYASECKVLGMNSNLHTSCDVVYRLLLPRRAATRGSPPADGGGLQAWTGHLQEWLQHCQQCCLQRLPSDCLHLRHLPDPPGGSGGSSRHACCLPAAVLLH